MRAEVEMGMTETMENTRQILKEALEKMEKGGTFGMFRTMMVGLSIEEVKYLLDLSDEQTNYEQAYNAGFEYGYQMAVKDVIKRLRGMKTYGGNNKAKRAAEVPEGTGRDQKAVQREI